MNPDDITPSRTITEGFRWFPATVIIAMLAFALFGGLAVAGHYLHWWLQNKAAAKSYSITVHSQAYQETLVQDMQARLGDISDIGVTRAGEPAGSPMQAQQRAQQLSALRVFCAKGAQLEPGNPAADQLYPIYSRNCVAGTVAPGAPLVK